MMKKSNEVNLQLFSKSILERMDVEIHRVLQLLQSERITFQKANEMLHSGKEDIQTIYYHVQCQIAAAQTAIIDLKRNGRFQGEQLESDNILSLATRRAIVSMRAGLESFKSGSITKRQLRRQHRMTRDLLDADVTSLNVEIRDMIRNLKPEPERKEPETWQDIPAEEMAVKKISHDSV